MLGDGAPRPNEKWAARLVTHIKPLPASGEGDAFAMASGPNLILVLGETSNPDSRGEHEDPRCR